MTLSTRLGKISLALFLAACCICPPPASAAPGLAKPAKPAARPTRSSRHHHYVREKGVDPTLGDIAGYNLQDEHPGAFPMAPPAKGGIARMSSFGEGIQMTPFQLASLAAAFANGGTLYYLQYGVAGEEASAFVPRIKRELNIGPLLPELREGMLAAVLYGTGKRSFDAGGEEMPAGKTVTCSDQLWHVGWFLTYADEAHPRIALAVLIRGNSSRIKGPLAAGVAGHIYRRLREQNYFSQSPAANTLATITA